MLTTTTNLATLQDHAAEEMRRALASSDADRTAHLRAVAEDYVTAREFFFTRSGDPDWGGRTYGYRTWVREVTGTANVPPSELGTIQAAIRYHIGNVLRERVPEDELAAAGLRKESPRERSVEKREGVAARLELVAGSQRLDTAEAIVDAAHTFARALHRVDMADLTGEDRDAAKSALMDLAAEAVRRAG